MKQFKVSTGYRLSENSRPALRSIEVHQFVLVDQKFVAYSVN